jgi:hypothetical protein
MTKYEVRVTQTHVDYYRIQADNEEQAKARVLEQVNNPKGLIYATKVDTIKRTPVIDYALQLSPEGEPIL